MDRRNYKSDYDFVLRLIDCHGEPVGWPSCDFEAVFFTTSVARGLKIWSKGGETGNCYNDEGRIHVAAKNAMLPPGKVEFELTLYVPDERFEGGVRKVVERKETGIELVTGGELCTCTFVVSAPLPVVGVIDTVVKETEERHYAELKGDLAALEEKLRGEAEAGDAETRRAAAEGDADIRDWAAGRFDDFDSMLGQEVSDVRGEIESLDNSLAESISQLWASMDAGTEKDEELEAALDLAKKELEEKAAGAIELLREEYDEADAVIRNDIERVKSRVTELHMAAIESCEFYNEALHKEIDTLSGRVDGMNILPFDGLFNPPTDDSVVQYPAGGVWWQPQEANFLFISSDFGYVASDYNEHLTDGIIRGRTDRIFCHDNILYHFTGSANTLLGAGVNDWEAEQINSIPRITDRLENQESFSNAIAGVFDGQIKELKARVGAIEEATEEEVMGALVEVPESVAGTAVGYVMLKKTVLGVKWKTIYESGSRYHKEVTVELEALGDFEVIRNDRVAVILDEPIRKADGTEIWNFNCRVVGVTEGKAVLAGDYYYSSSQEPVMPDILAGTMFMLYRQ